MPFTDASMTWTKNVFLELKGRDIPKVAPPGSLPRERWNPTIQEISLSEEAGERGLGLMNKTFFFLMIMFSIWMSLCSFQKAFPNMVGQPESPCEGASFEKWPCSLVCLKKTRRHEAVRVETTAFNCCWNYGSAKPMQRYSSRGEADKGTESPKEVCTVLL